jgi:hypothetical protein
VGYEADVYMLDIKECAFGMLIVEKRRSPKRQIVPDFGGRISNVPYVKEGEIKKLKEP